MTTLTTFTTKTTSLTKAEADANFAKAAQAKTTTYTCLEGDNRDTVECSGTFTVTLPVAATIAAAADTGDYEVTVKNSGTGLITIARSSTDTIDGATSRELAPDQSETYKVNQAGDGYNIISSKGNSVIHGVTTVNTGTSVEIYTAIPSWAKKITLTPHNIEFSAASANCNIQLGDASGWQTTVYFAEVQTFQASGITVNGLSTGAPITNSTPSITNPHFGHVTFTNKEGTDLWVMTSFVSEYGGSKTYFGYAHTTLTTSALTRMRILSGGFDGSGTVTYLIEG